MEMTKISILRLAVVCGFAACAGDFIVTFILGAMYPGYSAIVDSESYLGASASPVSYYMNLWGVLFFLFLFLFALGLKLTKLRQGFWQGILVWLIIIYGIGEGIGSGLFPYDHVHGALSISGMLHSVSGAVGGTALAFIPFVCFKIFPQKNYPGFSFYCRITFFNGLFFILLFLLSHSGIIPYKGLLQRVFILNYHLFIMVMALLLFLDSPDDTPKPSFSDF
jgi:hypothetical protein